MSERPNLGQHELASHIQAIFRQTWQQGPHTETQEKICMYVCMYVCIYMYYVCINVCMYSCMYICMHALMYVCTEQIHVMDGNYMHFIACVYVCMRDYGCIPDLILDRKFGRMCSLIYSKNPAACWKCLFAARMPSSVVRSTRAPRRDSKGHIVL